MTKREVVWLLVKVAGVCLLLNAFNYMFVVLENLLMVAKVDDRGALLSRSSGLIIGWVIEAGVSLVSGLYLIKDGSLLFEWLNHEPDKESLRERNAGYLSIRSTDAENS